MNGPVRRIAVITDSSHGIGAAIAMLLGDGGGSVAVRGRDRALVDAIAGEIRWEGTDACASAADAADAGVAFVDVDVVVVCEGASQPA